LRGARCGRQAERGIAASVAASAPIVPIDAVAEFVAPQYGGAYNGSNEAEKAKAVQMYAEDVHDRYHKRKCV
jgi:hypothetical protein